jgi:hypothetical protein
MLYQIVHVAVTRHPRHLVKIYAMTVEYELTEGDLNAFNLYHHFHSPTARRQYLRSWIAPALIMFVIWLGIWYLADRERGTPVQTFLDLLPLLSGVPIYLVFFPCWYRRKVSQIIAGMIGEGKNRGLVGRRQIMISPEGIGESGEHGKSFTAWRAVERVVRDKEYAFVYLNALAALIIPSRAFQDSAGFEEFVGAAAKYCAQAV